MPSRGISQTNPAFHTKLRRDNPQADVLVKAQAGNLDFIRHSGLAQTGRHLPDLKNVNKIAERLGPEVYDLLCLQRPDPDSQRLVKSFGESDAQSKEELLQTAEQIKQCRSKG